MKIIFNGIALSILLLVSTSATNVYATTIGFSELTAGTIVDDFYTGITFSNASVFGTTLPGQDDANGINSSSSGILFTQADEITAVFDNATDFVSVTGIDVGANGIRLAAFDTAGLLISEESVFGVTQSGIGEFFTLSIASAGIQSIAFSQILDFGFDAVIFDNLSFNEVSAVPVPAAAWLFGSALLGFFGFSRRKANA